MSEEIEILKNVARRLETGGIPSYRKIEFDRRQVVDVEGESLAVVSPEDLVLSKLFWAKDSLSEMQLRDVQNILETVANLDLVYIEKWVQSLELGEVYKRVASRDTALAGAREGSQVKK